MGYVTCSRLELTGLMHPFDSRSGGQQARLQILLLELGGATMLLLDEPTDNLDLVSAEGVTGITLRKVAVESDLNIGSVRHNFDGHHDLLVAAAQVSALIGGLSLDAITPHGAPGVDQLRATLRSHLRLQLGLSEVR